MRRRPGCVVVAVLLAGALSIGGVLVVAVGMMFLQASDPGVQCGPTSLDDQEEAAPVGQLAGGKLPGLDAEQSRNARIILAEGSEMNVSKRGLAVAIAAASQESGIRNLRHGDRDSLGLFQMRPSMGWGTYAQVTDPRYASRKFFEVLNGVPGWELLSVNDAAQKVERSGFPFAYEQWVERAWKIVEAGAVGSSLTPERPVVVKPVQEPGAQAGWQPVAKQAAAFIRDRFGWKGQIGGYSPASAGGHIKDSKHYQGLALDVMIPAGPLATRVQDYFAGPGFEQWKVENVIHNHRIYNRPQGWHAYSGPSPHTGHVHIDFTDGAAVKGGVAQVASTEPVAAAAVDCAPSFSGAGVGSDAVVWPAAKSANLDNFGGTGGHWARNHTGTDFSVDCGTAVKAATSGTVRVETGQGWAGRWLVKVETGKRSLTTWYAHMQAVDVKPGQKVTAGDVLGEVGSEGNSTGCHLHFELHPKNGSIYADDTDPTPWLKRNVGRELKSGGTLSASVGATRPGEFALASYNVLGTNHTGKASSVRRWGYTMRTLRRHAPDVIGFQEIQGDQRARFARDAGGSFATYAPPRSWDKDNMIAWRRDVFGARPLAATCLMVPYFHGQPRCMPAVKLRHKSGYVAWFLNVHNPADVRGPAAHLRAEAVRRELAWISQRNTPVYWTGDMNARGEFVDRVRGAGLRVTTPRNWIDHIAGTSDTSFRGTVRDDSAEVDASSDHPILVTRVRLGSSA